MTVIEFTGGKPLIIFAKRAILDIWQGFLNTRLNSAGSILF